MTIIESFSKYVHGLDFGGGGVDLAIQTEDALNRARLEIYGISGMLHLQKAMKDILSKNSDIPFTCFYKSPSLSIAFNRLTFNVYSCDVHGAIKFARILLD
jgi:hypothetical protein